MYMKYDDKVIVSVLCTVYNHRAYIRQCLEGILMQQASFRYEVIVHDDASTDGTQEIIKEIELEFPGIIKPIYQETNGYGTERNAKAKFDAIRGKYIAFCEGDDYWTDPLKLQKQIDFLETHPKYVFSCHRFKIYDQNNNRFLSEYANDYYVNNENLIIDTKLFSKVWVTQPLTAVIRTQNMFQAFKEIREMKYSATRDVFLFYTLLKHGNGISLNDFMGIYRWHDKGVAGLLSPDVKFSKGYNMYKEIYIKNKKDKFIKAKFLYNLIGYMRYGTHKEKLVLFKEGYKLSQGTKDRMNVFISFIIPRFVFNALIKIYLKIKWYCKKNN